jgi:hypothetical protein
MIVPLGIIVLQSCNHGTNPGSVLAQTLDRVSSGSSQAKASESEAEITARLNSPARRLRQTVFFHASWIAGLARRLFPGAFRRRIELFLHCFDLVLRTNPFSASEADHFDAGNSRFDSLVLDDVHRCFLRHGQ